MRTLSREVLGVVLDRLSIAVFVFRRHRLLYANLAAQGLSDRLRAGHRIDLDVMLRDHVGALGVDPDAAAGSNVDPVRQPIASLLTATNGEPFYVHVIPICNRPGDIAVSVRRLGSEIDAFRRRYGLSDREAQVAELVLFGYRNLDIASTLGITSATTKKHLTRVFDKVGVETRSQLQVRLA